MGGGQQAGQYEALLGMLLVCWFQVGNRVRGEVIHGRHFFKIRHGQENSFFQRFVKERGVGDQRMVGGGDQQGRVRRFVRGVIEGEPVQYDSEEG